VSLRVTARLVRPAARRAVRLGSERAAPVGGSRRAYFGREHGTLATPVLARADLEARPRPGPLLIDEYDATTLVPPGMTAALDDHGNILISTGGRA
jgi:N-methylhydantoinase A